MGRSTEYVTPSPKLPQNSPGEPIFEIFGKYSMGKFWPKNGPKTPLGGFLRVFEGLWAVFLPKKKKQKITFRPSDLLSDPQGPLSDPQGPLSDPQIHFPTLRVGK